MIENEFVIKFEIKYAKYKSLLYRIAYPYLKCQQDCEDILQETFIKLLYYSPPFESEEHEKRWLIRTTINLCKNRLKLFWNRKKVSFSEIDSIVAEESDKQILFEVLNLPDKYKSVIYLHYYEGYKCNEISDILKIGESTVKMRLKRAKEMLRFKIEERDWYSSIPIH